MIGGSFLRPKRGLAAALLASLLLGPGGGTVRAGEDQDSLSAAAEGFGPRRASRMEFDERLIMGQSLKAGAIYLFERKDSEIQSMLRIRKDFRKELLAPLEPAP